MVVCRNFVSTFKFYKDSLGLKATGGDGTPPWAEFQSDGVQLVLLEESFWGTVHGPKAPPHGSPRGGTIVLAIQVPDVDATYRKLTKSGTAFDTVPTDRPMMGVRNAMLRDPDGNFIEITTKLTKLP